MKKIKYVTTTALDLRAAPTWSGSRKARRSAESINSLAGHLNPTASHFAIKKELTNQLKISNVGANASPPENRSCQQKDEQH